VSYRFQRDPRGRLLETEDNLEEMRNLFLDWDVIGGDGGEGTKAGDGGAWHGVCHLVAAGVLGVQKNAGLAWFEVGWDQKLGRYGALVVRQDGSGVQIENITGQGKAWADKVRIVAYVEGNSCGAISNKDAVDPGNSDEHDRRQDYNRFPLDFESEGGKVWEHWCTTRDIRSSGGTGEQVLRAYLTLLAVGGTEFVATVLRGRPYCGHPAQLKACIESGLVTAENASWSGTPEPIPMSAQVLFQYSDPLLSFSACRRLLLADSGRQYFMFQRCIHLWQAGRCQSSHA
jgi:hypothetical protein